MKSLKQMLDEKKDKEIISIEPHRPVFDALVVMAEYRIGALAVMQNDKLVGIFSERDYARSVVLQGRSSKATAIAEVMTSNLICGKPNDLADNSMLLMSEKRSRHLPVMDGDNLVGMLSMGDLVKEIIAEQERMIKLLETYIKG
jgi:CBS domain-containing protein